MGMHVLVVGGQGTYKNGCYHTEHPDRELSIAHAGTVKERCQQFAFTHVVCAGGYTQKATPGLSEAMSFEAMWRVTGHRPTQHVSFDEVSLDSAENVLFGLMRLRLDVPRVPIERVGYYSQWQFKKPRMTGLASALGFAERFYFYAYADFALANAGRVAGEGEEQQLRKMREADDFLLLGKEWEAKRVQRFQLGPAAYPYRDKHLRKAFKKTFLALDELRSIASDPRFDDPGPAFDHPGILTGLKAALGAPVPGTSALGVMRDLVGKVRKDALDRLRDAFQREVLLPIG